MPLNDKQIRILETIDAGNTTGESVAEAMGSSMQMIRYYLDTMAEDGYLKVAKVYDNAAREFQIVRAYLTDKGKAILDSLREAPKERSKPVAPPVPSGKSGLMLEDLEEITRSLDILQQIVEKLPEERLEVIGVYLEDLQNEIQIVYRRKPVRIKAYFLAVLGTALPIVKQTEDADVFVETARSLSIKLNVPTKFSQP